MRKLLRTNPMRFAIHSFILRNVVSLAMFLWWMHVASAVFVCNDDYDCYPNGSCSPDLKCVCNSGYVGEQCEFACPLKCQNGGQCLMTDEHGGLWSEAEFSCDCPSTHTGGLCDDLVQTDEPCPLECANGGQCIANNGQFSCSCATDFDGPLCQQPLSGTGGVSMSSSESEKKVGRAIGIVVAVLSSLALLVVASRLCRHHDAGTKETEKNVNSDEENNVPDDVSLPSIK